MLWGEVLLKCFAYSRTYYWYWKERKPANVVIKFCMAKTYDRVSCFFLMKVVRKMGFSENFICMLWRLVANNYYSALINGKSHGFFHSTKSMKQGDPLSPTLFILSSEVLTRALNFLFKNDCFVGYGMPNGVQIRTNHHMLMTQ